MKDNILFSWTTPVDDWLIGLEFIPEVILPELEYEGKMVSFGLLIFRIDFLIVNKEEENEE